MIHDSLEHLKIPIEELHKWDRNPRRGALDKVKLSLNRFGQRLPIVYRTEVVDGEQRKVVYAGNHRLQAAYEMGWSEIAAVSADDMSPDEVRAFALADNRTGDLGGYDEDVLSELLTSIPISDTELIEATGYDSSAISALIERVERDVPIDLDPVQTPEAFGSIDPDEFEFGTACPKCGFEFDPKSG